MLEHLALKHIKKGMHGQSTKDAGKSNFVLSKLTTSNLTIQVTTKKKKKRNTTS